MTIRAELKLDSPIWEKTSKEAKDLIGLMLKRDPKERPNIKTLLKHDFFKNLIFLNPETDEVEIVKEHLKQSEEIRLEKYHLYKDMGKDKTRGSEKLYEDDDEGVHKKFHGIGKEINPPEL